MGGGVLFVPALAIFLDQSQIRAEATSLLAIVFVALVGTWRQRGYGNVRVRDGLLVGALSPLGVAAGVVTGAAAWPENVPQRNSADEARFINTSATGARPEVAPKAARRRPDVRRPYARHSK